MRRLLLIVFLVVSAFGREYIAVIDFDAIAVSEDVAKILTERLTSEMIALEVYQVIERKKMKRLLEEQKFQYSGCVELKCAIEIGKMLGAKYIVVGSVSKLGDSFSIDSRMISIETSEAYTSATFVHKGKIDILLTDGILSISKQLCELEKTNTKKAVSQKEIVEYREDEDSYDTSYLTDRKLFGGGLSIIGQIPQGEFKDEGVPAGFGLDLYGLWYPVKELGIGLNLGGTQYGSSKRLIPFSYYSDLITVIEKTTNNLGYAHLLLRIIPFHGNVRPYLEGLLGAKFLTTKTELLNNNCNDSPFTEDYDDCEIASSTNAWDNTFSYGIGTGLEITLTSIENNDDNFNGILSFFINARYIKGDEATYLKKGSITFTDPEDGPVKTTFNPSTSSTDVLQISLGVHFDWD